MYIPVVVVLVPKFLWLQRQLYVADMEVLPSYRLHLQPVQYPWALCFHTYLKR